MNLDDQTQAEIEYLISNYLQTSKITSKYILEMGRSFRKKQTTRFVLDHLIELNIQDWEYENFLRILAPELQHKVFGRCMDSLQVIYHDNSGGEEGFEAMHMEEVYWGYRFLKYLYPDYWSVRFLERELQEKAARGDFGFPSVEAYWKKIQELL